MLSLHVPDVVFYTMSAFVCGTIAEKYVMPCLDKKLNQELGRWARSLVLGGVIGVLMLLFSSIALLFFVD